MPQEVHPLTSATIEAVLRSAIVLSWRDFAGDNKLEKIQVAYELCPEGRIDHLKIWSSPSRGEWNFVCDYWMRDGEMNIAGARFATNHCPTGFEKALARVMENQSKFSLLTAGPQGMVVVAAPSSEDRLAAEQTMKAAFA